MRFCKLEFSCCSELLESLDELLHEMSSLTTQAYIIMIDGLNYLSKENNAHCVNWLPEKIPPVSPLSHLLVSLIGLEMGVTHNYRAC